MADSGVKFKEQTNRKMDHLSVTPVGGHHRFVDEDDEEIKKIDSNLDYGPLPLTKRKCTDIPCLIIFLAFSFYMFAISIMSFTEGRPRMLARPQDPDGRFCGLDEADNYPLIFWVNPMSNVTLHKTACVKECPTGIMKDFLNMKASCLKNSVVQNCEIKLSSISDSILLYDTYPYLGKVCLAATTSYFNISKSLMQPPNLDSWISDLNNSYQAQLGAMTLTILLGLLCNFLIQRNPKCALWSFIVIYFASLITIIVFFLYEYSNEEKIEEKKNFQDQERLKNIIREGSNMGGYYLFFGILAIILLIISLFIFVNYVFFSNKFEDMIQILTYSMEYLEKNTFVQLTPLFTSIAMIIYLIWWIVVAAHMFSIGEVKQEMNPRDKTPFNQFERSQFYYIHSVIHVLSLFYYLCFIMNFNFYIIGGGSCYYYFKAGIIFPKKDRERRMSVIKEQGNVYNANTNYRILLRSAIFYHLGSIAFGSLIIMLFGLYGILSYLIWFIKEGIEALMRKSPAVEKCLLSSGCLASFYYRFFYWITGNGFITLALKGDSFIRSGSMAAKLMDKNYVRYSLLSTLAVLFVMIGGLFITSLVVFFGYTLFSSIGFYLDNLSSPLLPCIFISIICFCFATVFLSLYTIPLGGFIICCFTEEELEVKRNAEIQAIRCPKEFKKFITGKSPTTLRSKDSGQDNNSENRVQSSNELQTSAPGKAKQTRKNNQSESSWRK